MDNVEERITYPIKEGDSKPVGSGNRLAFRQSNIELLRIICMVMIIAHHFCVHTHIPFNEDLLSFNRLWYEFLYTGGKIGVNVFILITGYFSFRNVTLKMGKVFQFYFQVLFYSVVIYAIFAIFRLPLGNGANFEFNWRTLVDALLPVTSAEWWFVSGYFVIVLLSPFLNYFICSIPKNGLRVLLAIAVIMYVVIPTFFIDTNFFTSNWDRNPVLWFMILYLMGAYLGKYGFMNGKLKTGTLLLIFFGICILTFGSVIIFDLLGKDQPWFIFDNRNKYMFEMQTIPLLIASVALFEAFVKLDIGSNKVINFVSSLTFGVYLIHDNPTFRQFFWEYFIRETVLEKWIGVSTVEGSGWFALLSIGAIAAVFIGCAIVEFIRTYVIEKIYIKNIKSLGKRVDDKVDRYIKKDTEAQAQQ